MKCNIQTLFNHMYFKFNCILYLKSLQYSRVLNVFPLPLNSNCMLGRSAFSCLSCDYNIPNNSFFHLSPTQCRVEGEVFREKVKKDHRDEAYCSPCYRRCHFWYLYSPFVYSFLLIFKPIVHISTLTPF